MLLVKILLITLDFKENLTTDKILLIVETLTIIVLFIISKVLIFSNIIFINYHPNLVNMFNLW